MRIIKTMITIGIVLSLIPTTAFAAEATTAAPISLDKMNVRSAMVIDLTSGQIIGEKNADEQVPIASQSKMLVAYGVLKQIQAGKIKWTDKVPITKYSDLHDQDAKLFSHIAMKTGDKILLRDLYNVMMTLSANDAAFALAEYITPKGQKIQTTLQDLASELNLKGSKWYNAAGQKNSDAFANQLANVPDTAENTASARQLGMMMWHLLNMNSRIIELDQLPNISYTMSGGYVVQEKIEHWYEVMNQMPNYSNPKKINILGGKTGSTPEAGGSFTGILEDKSGHRFLSIINGAGDYQNKPLRYQEAINAVALVLDQRYPHTFKSGQNLTNPAAIKLPATKQFTLPVQVAKTKVFWTSDKDNLTTQATTSDWQPHLKSVKKNQPVATAKVNLKGARFLNVKPVEHGQLNLSAKTSASPTNWFVKTWRQLWH